MHDLNAYVEDGSLGSGGFAEVVCAVHIATKERIALKKSRSDAEAIERTKREIEVQNLRLHGNVMPVLDWAADGSWFTMPLAAGDVGQVRERKPFRDADILRLVEDCASALGAAHRHGLVHRDLSPPNILWVGDRWMVADWGCVRMADGKYRTQLTRARTAMGTAPWASPEAMTDGREVDARADIYSLGRIVGWLVSGVTPQPNIVSLVDGDSPWSSFVRETTRLDRDERPASVYAVLDLLQPVIASLGTEREAHVFTAAERPDTTSVRVRALKQYLVDPQRRIDLRELVTRETESVFETLTPETFPVGSMKGDTIEGRLRRYVDCTSPLIGLMVAGCADGDEAQAGLWTKMLRRIGGPSGEWGGTVNLLHLRYLPASLLMHAGVLAAVATDRWYNVRALALDTVLRHEGTNDEHTAVFAASIWQAFDHDLAKSLPGMERKYVPASEWLHAQLRDPLRLLLPADTDYEDAFDRMEYLLALLYADGSKSGFVPNARVAVKSVRLRRFNEATIGARLKKEVTDAATRGPGWGPHNAGLFATTDRVLELIDLLEKNWGSPHWG